MNAYSDGEPVLLCINCTCTLKDIYPSKRARHKLFCNKILYSPKAEKIEFRHDSPLELYMIEKYGDTWVYGLNTL